jgi:SAM-dependent methyltransferase
MAQQTEDRVARHYGQGDLERRILEALVASGKDPDHLAPADLTPVDEFHTGGREATAAFAEQAGFSAGQHLLDIGCGIGGASRFFAVERGCRVTGIDLTEDYVRTAAALSRRVGLADRVSYRQASAVALPFADAAFDGAYMIHVGMNIEDKPALFAGVRRVVKPGGTFALFDIMPEGAQPPRLRDQVLRRGRGAGRRRRRTAAPRHAHPDEGQRAAEDRQRRCQDRERRDRAGRARLPRRIAGVAGQHRAAA